MASESRLGNDPLGWVKDTTSKSDLQEFNDNSELRSKQDLTTSGVLDTKTSEKTARSTSQKGLPPGWTRATFILKEEQLEKIKDVAYWERLQIKEVIQDALSQYLDGRDVQPRPEGR